MSFESDYRAALSRVSEELKVTPEELERELQNLSLNGCRATGQCLTLDEVRKWPLLPLQRSIHVRNCDFCQKLTDVLIRPDFLIAAENRARRFGITAQEVLDNELEALDRSVHPTADCLDPHELALIQKGASLPEARLRHLGECHNCQALMILMAHNR